MSADRHAEPLVGGDPALPPEGGLRQLLGRRLVRAGLTSYGFTLGSLAANLVTGIIIARALGPDGRGVNAAVIMFANLTAQLTSVGGGPALAYFASRQPEITARLHGTWTALSIPMALIGAAAAELMAPVVFAAQDPHAVFLAHLFVPGFILVLWTARNNGLLLGMHDFTVYNALRFLQPTLIALAYGALWGFGVLTLESSLIVWAVAVFLVAAAGTLRLMARAGIARPDRVLARQTLAYGVRAHGDSIAGQLNTRLDLVILPAYVAAAGVGLYSVAANVSLIINQIAASLAAIVLPAAARDQERGPRTVVLALQITLALACAGALALFLAAEVALAAIYGDAFASATDTLRILLPGTVLYGGSTVLAAGLHGAGRPLRATIGQVTGAVVTLVGLVIFVPRGGIDAAAFVSTGAYATVFLLNLIAYRRTVGLPWRALVAPYRF